MHTLTTHMKKLLFLPVFLITVCLFAQPSNDLIKYQALFKDADAVFLLNNRNVTVTYVKGKLVITQDHYEDLILLGSNVNKYSESSVGYSGMNDLMELDAKTMLRHVDCRAASSTLTRPSMLTEA